MRNLKKKVFVMLLSAFCAAQVSAIPARPGQIHVKQADGTTLTLRLVGDEHYHMAVTTDSYPLLFNSQNGNYEYAIVENNQFVSSNIAATEVALRPASVQAMLAKIDMAEANALMEKNMTEAQAKANSQYYKPAANGSVQKIVRISDVPTTGKRKVLVVLVNFTDKKFSTMNDPEDYYDRFFHQDGFSDNGACGSVYEFYRYGSNYKYDPEFDVFGPVQLTHDHSYYAGNGGTDDTYKLIQEALPLVDAQYGDQINWADYDTNEDGVIDNVYAIYAGYGQADSGDGTTIWPHSGNLTKLQESVYPYTIHNYSFNIKDDLLVDRYTVSQEINGSSKRTAGIGTFCHEFGHVLGLADHYNNNMSQYYSTNQLGEWDIMAQGSYNNDQNTPPTFSAFERYSLGWMDLTELTTGADSINVLPAFEETPVAYRVSVPGRDNEYFILENRQQTGWDKYLPGHGMLVWHLDEDQTVWNNNMPNYYSSHQRVDIVEADGVGSMSGKASDAYPGTQNVTKAKFNGWQKNNIFGLDYIAEEDGTIRFLLAGTNFKLQSPTLKVTDIMGTTAAASWNQVDLAENYTLSLLKGETVLSANTLNELGSPITGLDPETEYTAVLQAHLGDYSSDSVKVNFTTIERQIEESKVVARDASNVTETSFTANWERLPQAQSYELTLYSRTNTGEEHTTSGFDDGYHNLPEGWSTNATSTSSSFYGEEGPSLRLNKDSLYLLVSQPGKTIKNVSFWYRLSNTDSRVVVAEAHNGVWQDVAEVVNDGTASGVKSIQINDADSVRFLFCRVSGYALLDDVDLTYRVDVHTPLRTVTLDANGQELKSAAAASDDDMLRYAFSGLDATQQYSYSVQAFSSDKKSLMSDIINVGETTGINTIHTTDTATLGSDVFDLQGRKVATVDQMAQLPKGIYIVRGKKVVLK